MISIIVPVVIIVAIFGIIIKFFTGDKVLVFTFRSACFRLSAGLIVAVFPILWWGFKLYDVFTPGQPWTRIIVYALLACSLSACVLIPVGIIQVVGACIQRVIRREERT